MEPKHCACVEMTVTLLPGDVIKMRTVLQEVIELNKHNYVWLQRPVDASCEVLQNSDHCNTLEGVVVASRLENCINDNCLEQSALIALKQVPARLSNFFDLIIVMDFYGTFSFISHHINQEFLLLHIPAGSTV